MENISGEPPANMPLGIMLLIRSTLVTADIITVVVCLVVIVLFIVFSALVSSSENAFFSLTKAQIEELTEGKTRKSEFSLFLLSNPKKLLATILIANTFVNIAIVMVSSLMFDTVFDFGTNHIFGVILELTLITFSLVLLGEVLPKIYAAQNNIQVASFMAAPMYFLSKAFKPFVYVLVKSTSIIDKRITRKGHTISVDELTHAIDITAEEETTEQEKTILKSIVNFGNINVKQIMHQRPDISAVEADINFKELINKITDWGYSRIPVYRENLDNIIGVLYIKDLLPQLQNTDEYNWLSLIRKPYFVPESKKIDDLLKDFQQKRVHVAIIVDEFGGTSGMVTMEDILEEIFGEINDEFDEDEVSHLRINENTYVFEAKMLINDMCRYMEIDADTFEEIRNDADTIGGMLLELSGDLPSLGDKLTYKHFTFHVEGVDKRKINRVKVIVEPIIDGEEE
ncbi:MAG: gliding motility-associated protein GldE [Bacteroidota bacterium]